MIRFTARGSGCSIIGVAVSEVFRCSTRFSCRFGDDHAGTDDRVSGPALDRLNYGPLPSFRDPDGIRWVLQDVTTPPPGRIDPAATSFACTGDLAGDWADCDADCMAREQAGAELPW